MNTDEIIRLLGAFGLGTLLTAIVVAIVNHVLAERRWERERRGGEVAKWREFADRYCDPHYRWAQAHSLRTASEVPDDPAAVGREAIEELLKLKTNLEVLDSLVGRLPEPLTAHSRLFQRRVDRAYETHPPDQEAANHALVRFRDAVDEYVRRGKTSALKYRPGEPPLDDPY